MNASETVFGVILRWICLVWGCVTIIVSGSIFAYSCYCDILGDRIGLTTTQLNLAINIGGFGQCCLSIIPGIIVDHFGIRPAYIYGIVTMLAGYSGLYAQVKTLFSTSSYLAYLWFLLIGMGGGSFYITTMNNVSKNFLPKARPLYFGILVTCFGLSGAVFTAIYKRFFQPSHDIAGTLLTNLICVATVGIGALFTQHTLPPSKADVETNSYFGCGALIKRRAKKKQSNEYVYVEDAPDEPLLNQDGYGEEGEKLLDASGNNSVIAYTASAKGIEDETNYERPRSTRIANTAVTDERDVSGLGLLREPRYILLLIGASLTIGCSINYYNNTKLILVSNNYSEETTLLFLSLASFSNAFGRMVFGVIAFFTLLSVRKCMMMFCSHTLFLVIGAFFSFIGCTLLVIGQGPFTLIVACIQPLSYGCFFSVIPDYIQKKWGPKHFGFNLAFLTGFMCAVSMAMGFATGKIYDHALRQQVSSEPYDSYSSSASSSQRRADYCIGEKCFQNTFFMMFGCSLVSFASIFVLYILQARVTHNRIAKALIGPINP